MTLSNSCSLPSAPKPPHPAPHVSVQLLLTLISSQVPTLLSPGITPSHPLSHFIPPPHHLPHPTPTTTLSSSPLILTPSTEIHPATPPTSFAPTTIPWLHLAFGTVSAPWFYSKLKMLPTCCYLLWRHAICCHFSANKLFFHFSWLNFLFQSCVLVCHLVTWLSSVGLSSSCSVIIWLLAIQMNILFSGILF